MDDSSTSQNIGICPAKTIEFAQETQVYDGNMISEFGGSFNKETAKSSALEPESTIKNEDRLFFNLNAFSKSNTLSPRPSH